MVQKPLKNDGTEGAEEKNDSSTQVKKGGKVEKHKKHQL